jgi:hypothetical protein
VADKAWPRPITRSACARTLLRSSVIWPGGRPFLLAADTGFARRGKGAGAGAGRGPGNLLEA